MDISEYRRIQLPRAEREDMMPEKEKQRMPAHTAPSDNYQAICVGQYEGSLESWFLR